MDTGYLSQQVTTIINQLHTFFDDIGLPSHERDSRESEVRRRPCLQYTTSETKTTLAIRCPF